jgi:hypothetical protein
MMPRWRQRRAERIAEARKATERTKRLARAVSPLMDEAADVNRWAERRLERNHLADLFLAATGAKR